MKTDNRPAYRPLLAAAAALLPGAIAAAVCRADWPTFQHDNRRSGVTAEQPDVPLVCDWVFEPAGPPAAGWALPERGEVYGYGAPRERKARYDDCFAAVMLSNRVFFASSGDNRVYASGERVYGLGANAAATGALDADYTFVRLQETAYRRVRGDLYVGGGLLFDSHTGIAPADASDEAWNASPFVAYSQQHGLPLESQQSRSFCGYSRLAASSPFSAIYLSTRALPSGVA